jgi:hypothetical protein
MNIRRIIERRIRHRTEGVDVAADVNAVIAANVGEPGSVTSASNRQRVVHRSRSQARSDGLDANEKGGLMADKGQEYRTLSREELDALAGEPLPERAAMSLVNANLAIPVNAAIAANVLSDGAIAYADAVQDTPIDQSN